MGTKHDLLTLIRLAQRRHRRLPQILIDCGTEDSLLDANRDLHRRLPGIKCRTRTASFPATTMGLLDLHIREAIAFHARNLHLALPAK